MSCICAAASRPAISRGRAWSRSTGTSSSPSPPSSAVHTRPTAGDRLALLIATGLGSGYAPIAPGTVASALTVVGLWLLNPAPGTLLAFAVAVTIGGTWAAHRAEPLIGGKDPGAIVIDEVAGTALAALGGPLTPGVLFGAFLLFRLFDIVKPFPARGSQRLPGGIGVMIDDVIAGLYALIVLVVARRLLA